MYNKKVINKLVSIVSDNDGIADKLMLCKKIQTLFTLTQDSSVFYCNDFAIRFCKSKKQAFANTVLSLSALQKYDTIPFFVCLVTPQKKYLLLSNTTFLRKISHSSQNLRIDNIKGSFNGSDIIRDFYDVSNEPQNFEYLFSLHENFTFSENLERLVEATNNIQPKGKKIIPSEKQVSCIIHSIKRTKDFLKSRNYSVLNNDLQKKVKSVASEIVIAAFIDNVNLRGRIIEYLITSADSLRHTLIEALHTNTSLPDILLMIWAIMKEHLKIFIQKLI